MGQETWPAGLDSVGSLSLACRLDCTGLICCVMGMYVLPQLLLGSARISHLVLQPQAYLTHVEIPCTEHDLRVL